MPWDVLGLFNRDVQMAEYINVETLFLGEGIEESKDVSSMKRREEEKKQVGGEGLYFRGVSEPDLTSMA